MTLVKYYAKEPNGDPATAIAEVCRVAKGGNVEIILTINHIEIVVRPTSEFLDLMEIYRLRVNELMPDAASCL